MDTFTQVKKSKHRKRRQRSEAKSLCVNRLLEIRCDIGGTEFYKDTLDCLKKIIDNMQNVDCNCSIDLVCYGLGNITDSYIARYQLALLVALREDVLMSTTVPCEIYDPQFTDEECNILRQLDFNVLQHNQEGKRCIQADKLTVFYMPHCGKALYNNVLWSNWGMQLKKLIIIGNSFSRMIESTPSRILEKTAQYVMKLQPYTKEEPLKVPADYEDVFNDISIHYFTSLETVTQDTWNDSPEPVYTEEDAEIIFK